MQADIRFKEAAKQQWDLIVLPGGVVGAETMSQCQELICMLAKQKADGKLIGASGETPSIVLSSINSFLQEGATCFPLVALCERIPKASDYNVVVHDNVVTSQGIGSTLVFAIMLVELVHNSDVANMVAQCMLVDRTKYQHFPSFFDTKLQMVEGQTLDALSVEQMYMPRILYTRKDDSFLSDRQVILRKQIEFFVATQEDIDKTYANHRKRFSIGQVGIRCRHCAGHPYKEPIKGAIYFPASLCSIYQAGQNMLLEHFANKCERIDPQLKTMLVGLQNKNMGHGGKDY